MRKIRFRASISSFDIPLILLKAHGPAITTPLRNYIIITLDQ